jgi:hypothetical protein
LVNILPRKINITSYITFVKPQTELALVEGQAMPA